MNKLGVDHFVIELSTQSQASQEREDIKTPTAIADSTVGDCYEKICTLVYNLGVKIRNLKVDFKTGGTWRLYASILRLKD